MSVTVAPREIHDVVYRCGRVAGLDSGAANRLGVAVAYAETHGTDALGPFLRLIADQTICSTLAALDQLALAEVSARGGTRVEVVINPTVPRSLLAHAIGEAASRGVVCSAEQLTNAELASCVLAPGDTVGGDQRDLARASQQGITLDRATYRAAEDLAADFLVAEATLDAIAD